MQEPIVHIQSPVFRHVDAGRGTEWWSSGWRLLFRRGAAGIWIVLSLAAMVILALLHLVPLLGTLAAQICWFVFSGGLMLAARKTEQGVVPVIGDLFSGFGPSLGNLVVGAVLMMAGLLLVGGAMAVTGIGAFASAVYGALTGSPAVMFSVSAASVLAALLLALLLVPLFMAAWFAPALIVLRQQAPWDALKNSLSACWANMGALTVYGLLWIVFALVASVLVLGWLVLAPLMVLSTYTAYCDLFEGQEVVVS